MAAPTCSRNPCSNKTWDASGECWAHRGTLPADGSATTLAASLYAPPPTACTSDLTLTSILMDHPVDVGETIPKGWSIKRAVEEFRLPDNAIAINEALRAGTPLTDIEDEYGGDEEDDATYYQDIHDVLLYAARYSKLRQEVTVHRGTVEVPGQVATETPCWWSTSLNKDVAERFATESQPFFTPVDGARATIITLELPPGTHVINTLKEDVEEMILPPGTSWEPLSVEDDGMVRRIHGVVTDWMK